MVTSSRGGSPADAPKPSEAMVTSSRDGSPADAPKPEDDLDQAGITGWFDTHCHLQDEQRPLEVLQRARAAGVSSMVCVGTDELSSRRALELVRSSGDGALWATVGLHPHEATRGARVVEGLLSELACSPGGLVEAKAVAVGECGLDYHYDHSPREEQREAFAAQVELAARYGLTLVVHTRNAWEDTLGILAEARLPERVIFHCFTGGEPEARRCLDLGAWLSFSGIVTFKSAGEVAQAAAFCPEERLLLETDSPFLAPVPHRGQRNEPALLPWIGAAVAKLRGQAPQELACHSAASAMAAFGLR